MRTTASDIYYEPFDKACRGNLYDIYTDLRERAPVYRTPSGFYAVSRFDDVQRVLMDCTSFSSRPNQNEASGFPTGLSAESLPVETLMSLVSTLPVDPTELLSARIIVAADPPRHTQQRNLVNRAFTPRRIARLHETIHDAVRGCLEGIRTASTFEVVSGLAGVIPTQVISRLLSIDDEHQHLVAKWTEDVAVAAATEIRGTAAGYARTFQMIKEVADYFVPLIAERRRNPGDDLVSAIAGGEDSDTLSLSEILLFIIVLMAAGNGSTTNMIGNTVLALMQNRDQLRLLADRMDLIPNAIEESVRYRSSFQYIFRETNVSVEIQDVLIPKGATVVVMTGAANHDPRRFDHPERFDILREPAHIGFGRGPHFCLGANLARAQGIATLQHLVPHLPEWDLSGEPLEEFPGLLDFGYLRIPLVRRASTP